MKANIDLTVNQAFSTRRSNWGGLSRIRIGNVRISPFQVLSVYPDGEPMDLLDFRLREIVKTGNRESRHIKLIEDECETGNVCDCCGKWIRYLGWRERIGLCQSCQEQLGIGNRKVRKTEKLEIDTRMVSKRGRIWR